MTGRRLRRTREGFHVADVDRGPDRPDPLAMLRRPVPPPWTERVRSVVEHVPRDARPWAAAVGSVVVLLLVVGGVLWSMARPGPSDDPASAVVDSAIADLPMAGTTPMSPSSTAAVAIVAHAAGAVRTPGVYRLAPGARVTDLIDAAGGLAADADGNRLNLATAVIDGARVYVPRVGELVPPPTVEPETDPVVPSASGGGSDSGPVDLNRADIDALETLPGIGPSIAGAIVAHRDANGPFASVDDLLEVRGIGPTRLEQLRALVRV
jgi:competence protein ComEA